jgi:hypothetical protein
MLEVREHDATDDHFVKGLLERSSTPLTIC